MCLLIRLVALTVVSCHCCPYNRKNRCWSSLSIFAEKLRNCYCSWGNGKSPSCFFYWFLWLLFSLTFNCCFLWLLLSCCFLYCCFCVAFFTTTCLLPIFLTAAFLSAFILYCCFLCCCFLLLLLLFLWLLHCCLLLHIYSFLFYCCFLLLLLFFSAAIVYCCFRLSDWCSPLRLLLLMWLCCFCSVLHHCFLLQLVPLTGVPSQCCIYLLILLYCWFRVLLHYFNAVIFYCWVLSCFFFSFCILLLPSFPLLLLLFSCCYLS